MNLVFYQVFKKGYQKLPKEMKKRVDKQLAFLVKDIFYPSLKSKKMEGGDVWEARVSRGYRMTFTRSGDEINMLTVGQHDSGLGKK